MKLKYQSKSSPQKPGVKAMMRKLRENKRHWKEISLRHFKICTIGIIGGEKIGDQKIEKILTGRKIMI